MRWPWWTTRGDHQLYMEGKLDLLMDTIREESRSHRAILDALSLGMRALLEDLADRKKIAHDEEQRVGKTWVMSPGEQAQQEAQLLKESRTRRLKRQAGSDL